MGNETKLNMKNFCTPSYKYKTDKRLKSHASEVHKGEKPFSLFSFFDM